MSRFDSLEFGDNFEKPSEYQSGIKDENFYLAEARAAFESAQFDPALRSFAKVMEFNPKNAAAWTGQVRMLIELGEFQEAKLWADKALEKFPTEPELLAAKAVALGRIGDLKAALAFSDASIEERGDTPYVWLARAMCFWPGRKSALSIVFKKRSRLRRRIGWCAGSRRAFILFTASFPSHSDTRRKL
jgi:tetratricopeptide (TPR) repeat protein